MREVGELGELRAGRAPFLYVCFWGGNHKARAFGEGVAPLRRAGAAANAAPLAHSPGIAARGLARLALDDRKGVQPAGSNGREVVAQPSRYVGASIVQRIEHARRLSVGDHGRSCSIARIITLHHSAFISAAATPSSRRCASSSIFFDAQTLFDSCTLGRNRVHATALA